MEFLIEYICYEKNELFCYFVYLSLFTYLFDYHVILLDFISQVYYFYQLLNKNLITTII